MTTPSFQEDHISQVPALQLLQNLGYTYLRPQEVILQRKGRFSNVLLEGILVEQLRRMNRITYRGSATRVHGSEHSGGGAGAQGHPVRRAGADQREDL